MSTSGLVLLGLCSLVFLYASTIARAFVKLFSDYPLIRLAATSQFRARPGFVRFGALLIAAGVCVAELNR